MEVRKHHPGEEPEHRTDEQEHGEEVATADGDHHASQQEGDDGEQCDYRVESLSEGFVHIRRQTGSEKVYCGYGTENICVAAGLTGVEPLLTSMQKTELLHLHSLFAELKRHLEREGVIDGPLEPYESMAVRPAHAHKSKDRHREATIALASGVADELAKNSKYADDGVSEASGDDEPSETDTDAVTADG